MAKSKKKKSTPARQKYAFKKENGTWWKHKLSRIKKNNGCETDQEAKTYRERCKTIHGPKGRPRKTRTRNASQQCAKAEAWHRHTDHMHFVQERFTSARCHSRHMALSDV